MSNIKQAYIEELEEELTFEEAKHVTGDEYQQYKNEEILSLNSR